MKSGVPKQSTKAVHYSKNINAMYCGLLTTYCVEDFVPVVLDYDMFRIEPKEIHEPQVTYHSWSIW